MQTPTTPSTHSTELKHVQQDNFNAKDLSNLKEIKDFLDLNGVDYDTTGGNFRFLGCKPGARSYEIVYVPARLYPVQHKKNGIAGVKGDYFFKLSEQAESENSFKCWVKDYEWNDDRKREVLKSYFLHACGKTPNRFYARDCYVDVVDTKQARAFEELHCFYGKRGASLNLGLRLKKDKHGVPAHTLLMIYTMGHNWFGQKGEIEVLRVGTVRFSQVLGGSSKLLKHFAKNYTTLKIGGKLVPCDGLVFYSDRDHNFGSSMAGLGFDYVSASKGGFMNLWLDENVVRGRQPAKHKEIMQKMREGKVVAIPNAGVKTFRMKIDESMRGTTPVVEPTVESW